MVFRWKHSKRCCASGKQLAKATKLNILPESRCELDGQLSLCSRSVFDNLRTRGNFQIKPSD